MRAGPSDLGSGPLRGGPENAGHCHLVCVQGTSGRLRNSPESTPCSSPYKRLGAGQAHSLTADVSRLTSKTTLLQYGNGCALHVPAHVRNFGLSEPESHSVTKSEPDCSCCTLSLHTNVGTEWSIPVLEIQMVHSKSPY